VINGNKIVVSLGDEPNENILMEYEDPEPINVHYMAFMTGFGAEGNWLLTPIEEENCRTIETEPFDDDLCIQDKLGDEKARCADEAGRCQGEHLMDMAECCSCTCDVDCEPPKPKNCEACDDPKCSTIDCNIRAHMGECKTDETGYMEEMCPESCNPEPFEFTANCQSFEDPECSDQTCNYKVFMGDCEKDSESYDYMMSMCPIACETFTGYE
jgi:hypothetical protein